MREKTATSREGTWLWYLTTRWMYRWLPSTDFTAGEADNDKAIGFIGVGGVPAAKYLDGTVGLRGFKHFDLSTARPSTGQQDLYVKVTQQLGQELQRCQEWGEFQ